MSDAKRQVMKCDLGGDLGPEAGMVGEFVLAQISDLRVDHSYQRSVTPTSIRNIRQIGRRFDWRKFAPVIGARQEDGTIAIIDGQHRCTAALSRGILSVPVYVLNCSYREAASAFAAINGQVTPMSKQDIYRASLAAGDPDAMALQDVLTAAEVTVVSIKSGFGVGQTRSIGVLQRALRVYGPDILRLALQCITQTGKGNAGLIYGATVIGICEAIKSKTDFLATPSKLFDIFDALDFPAVVAAVEAERVRTGNTAQDLVRREIHRAIVGGAK